MRYDFVREIDAEAYAADNVVYLEDSPICEVTKPHRKPLTVFGFAVIQLCICLVISLTFIGLQLWTDLDMGNLTKIVKDTFGAII